MTWFDSLIKLRLERLVQTPYASTLGKTLLHSLWEGAAIALVLALVLCVARSSRVRYAAACVAMVVMLSGLVVTFARLAPEEPITTPLTGASHLPPLPTGHIALSPLSAYEKGPMDNLAWLAPFWIAGVLIFHLRGITSWMAARRLRRTGVCCAPELWRTRLDRLRTRLRVTRPVALLESSLAEVPVVIGYLRPIVLMPVGLLAGLPTAQVEAILLHELAHIRRYDYLVNLLQVFVEGLLFYHPAVWWISGVMRTERENCCDDLVVSATGSALEYATALTALEQRREDAGMVLAATGGSLVNRIQRLLGRPERRYAAVMPVFTAAILTVTVVTAMLALQMGSGVPGSTVTRAVAAGVHTVLPTKAAEKVLLLAQAQPAPGPATATMPSQAGQSGQATSQSTTEERKEFVEEFWLQRDVAGVHTTLVPQVAAAQAGQALQPDKVLYDRAMQQIESRNYLAARLTLNTLINTYGTSQYLMRAKLAIADSWAREGTPASRAQAVIEYKDFILFYPNTPEAKEAALKLAALQGTGAAPDAGKPATQGDAAQPAILKPLTPLQQKRKEEALKQELMTPYKKWMDEEVVYIISDEERKAFKEIRTDEEREHFVEQFWLRRDPTPGTEENEFKGEHYRRIGYANEHFAEGIPGWRTDRGRIYIQYGPPDEIEAHPAGGKYQRPAVEGGGETETYPFVQWRYKLIDGVGQNVIVEFVDKTGKGEYKMTVDPHDRDQLLNLQAAPGR